MPCDSEACRTVVQNNQELGCNAWRKTKSVSEKDFWINASADLDCMQTIWMHQITYLSIQGIAANLIQGISSEDLKDTEFLKNCVHFLSVA